VDINPTPSSEPDDNDPLVGGPTPGPNFAPPPPDWDDDPVAPEDDPGSWDFPPLSGGAGTGPPPSVEYLRQFNERVNEAAQQWEVVGAGDRPEDWCLRDVLFSGLIRDPRARWFREAIREQPYPEGWFRALHRRQLFKVAQLLTAEILQDPNDPAITEYFAVGRIRRKLERLWACPPCGVRVVYHGTRTIRRCGLVWLCPWCNARAAYAAYTHILQCVAREPQDGRVPAVLWAGTTDEHARVLECEPEAVLAALRRGIYRRARRLGADGGLLVHTVQNPAARDTEEPVMEHALALVALIDPDAELAGLTANHRHGPDGGLCPHSIASLRLDTDTQTPATALRRLIFGADAGWYSYAADGAGDADVGSPTQASRPGWGAACLAAVGQFPAPAWLAYEDAIHDRVRFRLFGSWRRRARRCPFRALLPTPERLASIRQGVARDARRQRKRQGLAAENLRRQEGAEARRQALLEQLRPAWAAWVEAHRSAPGRLATHKLIAAFFRERGMTLSQRDLRWLAARV
jgi:hypothetical protein